VIGQAIYAATDAGNIFVSTNNGASWDAWGEGLPTRYSISCLVAVGEDLFAGVPQPSWLPPASAAPAGLSLSVGGQYLFAGGPPPTGRLFVRAKGAPKWKDTRIRLSRSVNSLVKIGTALFLGTDSGLYLCENYSQSPKALKLEARFDLPVRCLAMVGTSLVMGTYDGVHIVKADGEKWTFVDTGLPKGIMVSSLAATGTHLFAGTSSEWRGVAGIEERGVWRLPLAALDRFRQ
jgi:hypothetical protein